MTNKKTSTGLRIGISVSMVIMMLGLAIVLNVFTTYAITNQTKILSDFNIPISQGISQVYAIQQMQYQSFEDAITYKKLDSSKNYEFSKSQFNSHNKELDYQIIKIKNLANTYLDSEQDEKLNTDLRVFINKLDEITKIHLQYDNTADRIFELQDNGGNGKIGSLITVFETEHSQISSKTIILNDQIRKITDNLGAGVEQSKQKSLTLQAIIIISAGIISVALCHFLNLINKDIIQEVVRKTMSLQRVNRKLEKMSVLKDDFINIASHELMSPLQPLYGYVELAQNGDIGKDEALVGISKQAKQLEEVANRILHTGRTNYERQSLTFEKFNLSNMLMEIVSSYVLNLRGKVKIETDFEDEIEIEADRIGIGQVMRNLINNAIKFTDEGSIKITAHYNIEKNLVEVSISDSGTGIHPDILPKLFNKLVTKGPEIESWRGNGFGLYLCRDIINMHGGHITAHNNKDSGATIKFTIPILKHTNVGRLQQEITN